MMNSTAFDRTISRVHRFATVETQCESAKSRISLFGDKKFEKLLRARLEPLLADSNTILSLDVFDTLFLRDNSSELERFLGIGKAMAAIANKALKGKTFSAEDAFQARYLGTLATYRAREPVDGFREGSLKDIHRVASRLLTGSDFLQQSFIDAELAYEAKTLTLNPLVAAIAREHRKKGGRVLLLSDMYLHGEHIIELGEAIGWNASEADLVISSADECISKASGRIFRLAEKRMNAKPKDFVHLGDSYRGDFQKPVQAGWHAIHLPLSEAETVQRRNSHISQAEDLFVKSGIETRIAMPG